MAKVCAITGKKPLFGHNVSKANNKTKRRFNPNLAKRRIWLPGRQRYVRLTISHQGQRILDKHGAEAVLDKLGLI